MKGTAGLITAGCAALLLASPAAADSFERMLRGESAIQGKKLQKAIAKAETHPLGSAQNPVRTTMPIGERLYLSRLRCSDGKAPQFARDGSVGIGPFGNILDLYTVVCAGAEPAESKVYMDMYHGGFIESRAVPGFSNDTATPAGPAPASPAG